MKNLALLCTLHADGPKTADLLRRDGCEGLAALLEYEPRDLARLLEWSDTRAERFLREASELSERLGRAGFVSQDPYDPPEVLEGGDETDELDWDEEEREDTTVQEILDTWRNLDETDPPERRTERPTPEVSTRGGDERDGEPGALDDAPTDTSAPRAFVLPRPARPGGSAGAGRTPLRAIALGGLGPDMVDRLTSEGITSAELLLETAPLELAERLGLGLTRVLRMQFLVRRSLGPTAAQPS